MGIPSGCRRLRVTEQLANDNEALSARRGHACKRMSHYRKRADTEEELEPLIPNLRVSGSNPLGVATWITAILRLASRPAFGFGFGLGLGLEFSLGLCRTRSRLLGGSVARRSCCNQHKREGHGLGGDILADR